MADVTNIRGQAVAPATDRLSDLGAAGTKKPRSLWSNAWRQFKKHRLAMAGVVTLGLLIVAVLVGPIVWPKSRSAIDFNSSMLGVSWAHPMGTDDLGHDIFARVLWGGRISMAVGLVAMLIAISVGTMVGAISGFFGKFIDSLLMRINVAA